IQPLADEGRGRVRDVPRIAPIIEACRHRIRESQEIIEFAEQHQPSIAGQRAAREVDDKFRLESESELRITGCRHRTSCVAEPSRSRHRESTTTFSRAMAFLRTNA